VPRVPRKTPGVDNLAKMVTHIAREGGGEGHSHIERTGVLVGKFEKNP